MKKLSTKELLVNLKEWAGLLRISEDRLEILSDIEEPERMGAVLYGIIVGTPAEELVAVMEKNESTDDLLFALQGSLMKRMRDNDEIYDRIERDQKHIDVMIADHNKLWETMLAESKSVMEGAFAEKDKLIEEKEKRIAMLEKQLEGQQDTDVQIEPAAESIDTPATVSDQSSFRLTGFLSAISKDRVKRTGDMKTREREVLRYRDEFLLSDKYDRDQKQYFIDCMHRGVPFEKVKNLIGNPNLSSSDMKQIMAVFGR
ncbi:MAG: hypothetical protein K6B14_09485 [Lachnospiraceae bacterium]|nr:hypothetical protein [Lachnospiraceae bacterium]